QEVQTAPSSEVIQALSDYINAEDWEQTRQVLIQRQAVLFRPEAETVLQQNITTANDAGEQQWSNLLTIHLDLLRACKAHGIDAAFEHFMQAMQLPFDPELISRSRAALRGGLGEKMAHAQYLSTLATQTTDEGTKQLINAIQQALFGGDLSHLGEPLSGVYRQAWEAIIATDYAEQDEAEKQVE